eukprot:gene12350-biopygen2199
MLIIFFYGTFIFILGTDPCPFPDIPNPLKPSCPNVSRPEVDPHPSYASAHGYGRAHPNFASAAWRAAGRDAADAADAADDDDAADDGRGDDGPGARAKHSPAIFRRCRGAPRICHKHLTEWIRDNGFPPKPFEMQTLSRNQCPTPTPHPESPAVRAGTSRSCQRSESATCTDFAQKSFGGDLAAIWRRFGGDLAAQVVATPLLPSPTAGYFIVIAGACAAARRTRDGGGAPPPRGAAAAPPQARRLIRPPTLP